MRWAVGATPAQSVWSKCKWGEGHSTEGIAGAFPWKPSKVKVWPWPPLGYILSKQRLCDSAPPGSQRREPESSGEAFLPKPLKGLTGGYF